MQHKKTQPLVVISTKSHKYERYEGKVRTDHVSAEFPMDRSMIEQFRIDPASLFEDEDDIA